MRDSKEESELNELAAEIHENAVNHGWWDYPPREISIEVPTKLMLVVTELSEAMEEFRNGSIDGIRLNYDSEHGKPEGFGIELADAVIRILDLASALGIDMDLAIRMKHEYNKTRPYRHGGKHA